MTYVVGDATHIKSKPLSGSLASGETWVYDGTQLIPAANEAFKFINVNGTVLDADTSADTLHLSGVSGIKLTPVSGDGAGSDGIIAEVSGLVSDQIPSWSEISGMAEGGSGIAVYASAVAVSASGIAVEASGIAVGASGIAVTAVTPDYVPPSLLYKDANEITVPKGRYYQAGHRWNGQYQDTEHIARHWDIEANLSIQVDATYVSGSSPGMIDGAKVNESWYSVLLVGDTASDVLVLPFLRVNTVDYDTTFSGKTTLTPASHNGGVSPENGFAVSDHAWNSYRLVKANDRTIGADPLTVEETLSGPPVRVVINGDHVSGDPSLAPKDWLQLIPPAGVPFLYLGAVRIDASGTVSPFSAAAPGIPGNCPAGVTQYATAEEAENSFSLGDCLIQVVETETFYRFEENGASHQVDHLFVLNTILGGTTRWIGVAGRFGLGEVGIMQGIADGRMIVCPAYYQTGSDQAVPLTSSQHAIASLIVPEVKYQIRGIARRVKSVTTSGTGTFEIRANSFKLEPNGALNGSTTNAAPTMTANNAPSPCAVTAKDKFGNDCVGSDYAFLVFNGDIVTDSSTSGWAGLATSVSLDNGPAVDKGGGKVGVPCTGHACSAGDRIKITDSTNYSSVAYAVDATSTANEIVITETYAAETFSGAHFEIHACSGYPIYLTLDLGEENSLAFNKLRMFSRASPSPSMRGFPSAWTRYASNLASPNPLAASDWDTVGSASWQTDPGQGAALEVAAVTATPYRHHMLKLTGKVSTATSAWMTHIQEIQLFEAQQADAPGELLAALGTLAGDAAANWNILTATAPYTLIPGEKYWISETGESSKSYSVSTSRCNPVTGSAHPAGMVSKYTTDGGMTWSQCLQDSLPALWNMIVNPADPLGDGAKPVPQLCYGATSFGDKVFIPDSGLITIPDEGILLDLSSHDSPDPEFGYHVWLSHSGGGLHLSATKEPKETTDGIIHKEGEPGFRWIGDVYPVQCQPGEYGPVDVKDRCLISYPGMKRILGKPNPYCEVFAQTILGTHWRAYDEGTDSWRIEFLACGLSELTLTACCRLAAAGNYALPSIGIDGKLPAPEASSVQSVSSHALLNSDLTVTVPPGIHFAYPLLRGKGASCNVQYYGSEVDNREAYFGGGLQC
jgi:hypothetical protein